MQCIKRIVTTWQISDASLNLFYDDDAMAVGVYNDSIFLIGGYRNRKQVTEYKWKNTATNTMIDLGNNILPVDVYGYGQFWVQKDHILYLIEPTTPNHIATYNMMTNEFTPNTITINTDVYTSGCLALSDSYLYVTGGWTGTQYLNTVQVLNISSYQWTLNAPPMIQRRSAHTCIAHNDYLWAFGGSDGSPTETNERIRLINITQNSWEYVDPLTYAAYALRCVLWREMIYIIGGRGESDVYFDIVSIMDGETGFIAESTEHTPLATAYSSPIIVDGVLYVFGGVRDNGVSMEQWLYYILETTNPTINPSNAPSNNPSVSETTRNPTEITSQTPSNEPFYSASISPSQLTTVHPSISPSQFTTVHPSLSPSLSVLTDTASSVSTPSDYNVYESQPRYNDNASFLIRILLITIVVLIIFIFVVSVIWIIGILIRKRRKELEDLSKNVEIENTETIEVDGAAGEESVEVMGRMNEHETTKHYWKCSLCGSVSEHKMQQIKGLCHCDICFELNDDGMDSDVEKMFEVNANNKTNDGNETTKGTTDGSDATNT